MVTGSDTISKLEKIQRAFFGMMSGQQVSKSFLIIKTYSQSPSGAGQEPSRDSQRLSLYTWGISNGRWSPSPHWDSETQIILHLFCNGFSKHLLMRENFNVSSGHSFISTHDAQAVASIRHTCTIRGLKDSAKAPSNHSTTWVCPSDTSIFLGNSQFWKQCPSTHPAKSSSSALGSQAPSGPVPIFC